jgi:putative ABC transport system permease protein
MSIGQGAQTSILNSISSLGANMIYVSPGSASFGGVLGEIGSAGTLTFEDAAAISANVSDIDGVAPVRSTGMQVIAGNKNMSVQINGITPEYQSMNNYEIQEGDFINQTHYDQTQYIAVIGATVSNTLFEGDNPIGQKVRMGTSIFTIIGLLQSQGEGFSSNDNLILIPLSTMFQISGSVTTNGQHIVNSIQVHATDQAYVSNVVSDITYLLEDRHKITNGESNDFSLSSTDQISSTISSAMQSLTLLLAAIAGISLLVGGIGVMNIMLVSIMERRREIGIRKALGAKERDIWGQFLLDSALLTFAGGIIGVAIGWGVSALVTLSGLIATQVTTSTVLLAVGVSVGIGLFFGFYPAYLGSRLDPIQALRSE